MMHPWRYNFWILIFNSKIMKISNLFFTLSKFWTTLHRWLQHTQRTVRWRLTHTYFGKLSCAKPQRILVLVAQIQLKHCVSISHSSGWPDAKTLAGCMVVPPAPLRRRIMLASRLVQLCCLLVPGILAPVRLLRAFLRPLAQTVLLLVAWCWFTENLLLNGV